MNFKFYQHLTLHVITPVWSEKNRCNISSKHCSKSLCINNLYFNLKDNFLFVGHRKISWNGDSTQNTCENVEKNRLFLADPLFLQHSLYLPLSRSKKLLHVSDFQKYLFFSTRADISGVIFIHTWETFLGHPCILLPPSCV